EPPRTPWNSWNPARAKRGRSLDELPQTSPRIPLPRLDLDLDDEVELREARKSTERDVDLVFRPMGDVQFKALVGESKPQPRRRRPSGNVGDALLVQVDVVERGASAGSGGEAAGAK